MHSFLSISNRPFCEFIPKHHITTPAFSLVADLVTPRVIKKTFRFKILKTLRDKKYFNLNNFFFKSKQVLQVKIT